MLAPLLALVSCALAALSGAALLQPMLAAHDAPPMAVTAVAAVFFVALLVPPVLLSGDWLWMNGKRRAGPPRGQIIARLAIFTGVVALAVPLVLTERPLPEVASSARAVPMAWAAAPTAPKGIEPVVAVPSPDVAPSPVAPPPVLAAAPPPDVPSPDPTIKPTPADVVFPTAPVVLEAQPLRVIDQPTARKLPEAEPGTFFVYEWKDTAGATHWCNVFEEIPPDGKVLKATVMKPVEPKAPPAWVVASAPRANEPSSLGFLNDPRLPSYAEQHWRNQFRRSHSRIRDQERRIAAKQREIDEAAAMVNRRSMEEELRVLKQGLADLQQEDNDLEREASFRAVPREWRN